MSGTDLIQILIYCGLIALLTPLAGAHMARVFTGARTALDRILGPVERAVYRVCGVDPGREQHWTAYATAALAFNLAGALALYALLRLQAWLPLNPAGLGPVAPDLALNTAVSFTTNTDWQAYGGESTLSLLSQMVGMTVQNFASAATGIAVLVALVRGLARRSAHTVGNFTVDVTRATLYVLLPVSVVAALVLVAQGVPQTLDAGVMATTVEGGRQGIALGPVASQIAIKQLGSNGGGFFSVNAAHPFENPTPLANLVEMVFLLVLAAGLTATFGRMVGDRRQGWAIFAAMGGLFVAGLAVACWAEVQTHPALVAAGMDPSGGVMEGKEVRFGIVNSALWAVATTAASNGSVNAMHDSFSALGGMVPLVNMLLGEVVFGGVGAGLYGMLVFVLLAVFIAGLMVGRTPEYLGKKIDAREITLAMLAVLAVPLGVLGFAALTVVLPAGLAGIQDPGPHGLSEVLYAYASAAGNNGSAFAGFNANTVYHNTTLALAMLLGRYMVIVPVLAIAGSLAAKGAAPASAGTFPTHGPLFVGLLAAIVLIVGGLTFFPALALGPVLDHLTAAAATAAAG